MRVALDARYLRRRDVGISLYLRGMLGRLLGSGADLTLLTDAEDHARELAAEHRTRAVGLSGRPGFAWEQVTLPRWLRRERPDALIAGANYGLPLWPVRGVRRVAVVHDLIPLRLPRLYATQGAGWIGKYLASTGITLAVADAVLTPSEATARDVRRLRRGRPVVVRAPDLPAPAGAGPAPPPEGWPRRYVLYNGGRDARKNVPVLLEAHALYRRAGGDHDLVLMGRGHEEQSALLARLGTGASVHMPGFVDEELKRRARRAAGAVAYPSRWEGYGLPLVEAFAAGVPVVAGRGGAQAEIGGDAAHYVDVGDAADVAAGLRAALEAGARERARREGPLRLAALAAGAEDPLPALLAQPPLVARRRR